MIFVLNKLKSILMSNFIVNYSLQSEVAEMKEKSRMAGGRYIQNQQLEEIRNCQEQLDKQQKQWAIDLRKQKEEANAEEQRMKDERVRIKIDARNYS